MRQLVWATLCLMSLCVSAWSSPTYRAGQSASTLASLWHAEVSADYQFSSQKMQTKKEDQTTSALKGWNVRALWAPISWLSVGAEMSTFNDEKLNKAFVSSYETNRLAGIVKLTLSPDTSPRVYVLAGYGRTEHQINYDHSTNPIMTRKWPSHDKKNIPYWMVGLGIEVDIWKFVFVGLEGDFLRHQTTELPRFYKTNSKTETLLRLRTGVRF